MPHSSKHGWDHRAEALQGVETDAFEQFLAADVLLIGFVAAQGALRMFERFLHKDIGVRRIPRVRLHYFPYIVFKVLRLHIRTSASKPPAPAGWAAR